MENKTSSISGTISAIALAALVSLYGLYVWGQHLEENEKLANQAQTQNVAASITSVNATTTEQ